MNRFSVVAASAFLAFAIQANAEGTRNMEPFYQPASGKNALEFALGSGSSTITVNSKATGAKAAEVKLAVTSYGLSYTHGLTNEWALGLGLNNITTKTDLTMGATTSSMKSTGFGDLDFYAQNSTPMDGFTLHYGTHLGFSPEKSKKATTTADGNSYSGGFSLTPYIGAEKAFGQYLVGGKFEYAYHGDRTQSDNGNPATDSKIKGGNALALTGYFEYDVTSQFGVVAALGYSMTGATDTTDAANATETEEAYNTMTLGLAAAYFIQPDLKIQAGYQMANNGAHGMDSTTKVDAYTTSTIAASVRYEF